MVHDIFTEQFKVPAHSSYLRILRNFVTRIGTKYGFSSRELYAFKASVDEACTNIIEHGYEHKEGFITIRAIVKDFSLTIELVDHGKTFNPMSVSRPDLNQYVSLGKKGGLGVFIIQKLLDEVDYESTQKENILRLTKFRRFKTHEDVACPSLTIFQRLKNFLSIARS